jgi:CBS domain-containing protein
MQKTAGELKSPALFSLRPEDPIERAADYLLSMGVNGAPVLDDEAHPVGVVSLAHLLATRVGEQVADRMTRPAIVVRDEQQLEDAARVMVGSGVPRLVVVDTDGRASGVLTALDVIGALLGVASGAQVFVNLDPRSGIAWTEDHALSVAELGVAPSGPGLLALVRGGGEVELTVVWSEAAHNVRKRLWDMVSHPDRETPQLARLLESCRDLRFRAASVPDAQTRRTALEQLRAQALGHSRPVL